MVTSLGSCSLIDDDLDDCDTARSIELWLHPYSGIDSLLAAQITGADRQEMQGALMSYYSSLLYSSQRNVGMNFYNAETGALLSTENVSMQGDDETFSIQLPSCDLNCVAQSESPLYSGRSLMPVGLTKNVVDLYPADAQVALLAKVDSNITDVQILVDGCASAFSAADSTYTYNNVSDTLVYRPSACIASRRTYAASLLPSQPGNTWSVTIFATTSTGSITRTVLTVQRPLRAGDLRILQVTIGNNGAAMTTDVGVGASVTLDWKKGGDYNPDL